MNNRNSIPQYFHSIGDNPSALQARTETSKLPRTPIFKNTSFASPRQMTDTEILDFSITNKYHMPSREDLTTPPSISLSPQLANFPLSPQVIEFPLGINWTLLPPDSPRGEQQPQLDVRTTTSSTFENNSYLSADRDFLSFDDANYSDVALPVQYPQTPVLPRAVSLVQGLESTHYNLNPPSQHPIHTPIGPLSSSAPAANLQRTRTQQPCPLERGQTFEPVQLEQIRSIVINIIKQHQHSQLDEVQSWDNLLKTIRQSLKENGLMPLATRYQMEAAYHQVNNEIYKICKKEIPQDKLPTNQKTEIVDKMKKVIHQYTIEHQNDFNLKELYKHITNNIHVPKRTELNKIEIYKWITTKMYTLSASAKHILEQKKAISSSTFSTNSLATQSHSNGTRISDGTRQQVQSFEKVVPIGQLTIIPCHQVNIKFPVRKKTILPRYSLIAPRGPSPHVQRLHPTSKESHVYQAAPIASHSLPALLLVSAINIVKTV